MREFVLGVIIVCAVVATFWYFWRTAHGTRALAKEVYLRFDPNVSSLSQKEASGIATTLAADVATPGQVALYALGGGAAAGAGLTSTGEILWAPGAPFIQHDPFRFVGSISSPPSIGYGVWCFGPKPAKTTATMANIAPFSCGRWFQPQPTDSRSLAQVQSVARPVETALRKARARRVRA